MAKTTIDVLISELCTRMNWSPTAAGLPRVDCLNELDRAEKFITQRYSLSFLTVAGSLSLGIGASTAPLLNAPQMDIGKDVAVQNSGLSAELQYIPPDEWYETGYDSYGMWANNIPLDWSIFGDVTGVPVFNFRPGNTSGGIIILAVIYQRTPVALVDANSGAGSTSLLPEGFEKTILINRAEAVLKRVNRRPGWEVLYQAADADLEVFYHQYRTTKEKPWTDREQQERKIARDKMAEGA